jgi:hypothetical protein
VWEEDNDGNSGRLGVWEEAGTRVRHKRKDKEAEKKRRWRSGIWEREIERGREGSCQS